MTLGDKRIVKREEGDMIITELWQKMSRDWIMQYMPHAINSAKCENGGCWVKTVTWISFIR